MEPKQPPAGIFFNLSMFRRGVLVISSTMECVALISHSRIGTDQWFYVADEYWREGPNISTKQPEQSKFTFFQVVEDTVEGVITFIDRALVTLFHLAVLPHRFPQKWQDESSRKSFTKPFTTLAISVFTLYLAFAYYADFSLRQTYPAAFEEKLGNFRDGITLTRLFLYSIPVVVILYWLSRLVSRLTVVADDSRANLSRIALYACSFQCLTATLSLLCYSTLGAWTKVLPVYGFAVFVIIMWNPVPSGRGLRQFWRGCVTVAYASISLVVIWGFVLVGFATEKAISPEGPKLVEEHRKKLANEFVEMINEASKDGVPIEDHPSYEKIKAKGKELSESFPR